MLHLHIGISSNMKSPHSSGRRWNSTATTPQYPSYSPGYSTYSSSTATSSRKSAAENPVKNVVRLLADSLVRCFTPPEQEKDSSYTINDSFEATSSSSEKRRNSSHSIYGGSNTSAHTRQPGSVIFTIEQILKATGNFSPNFKIGQGGFGTVYKGQLDDGTVVAVKRAKKTVHDLHSGPEFQNEVQTLLQVEHLSLVKFYGHLENGNEKLLVVEYVPNGTFREHLDCLHGNTLDFASRLDIAIDVAHAVTYLHTYTDHPIIHRDIKSSNILLTENLRAKVADFGFARMGANRDSGATHISTQVKGTAGYLDPEYLSTYQLTEKSDVYSFGVLLVELITGRRPLEPKREPKERVTAKWAMRKFTSGEAILALDPKLARSPANNFAMEKIFELSFRCLAPHRQNRPSMRKCAEILWSVRKDYKELLNSGT